MKNLSTYTDDASVLMVLTKLSAPSGQYLKGPTEVKRNQQWELSNCPVGEQLTVVIIDDGGKGFGTPAFTLAEDETKTLVYRGGGSYGAANGGDDFTVTND